MKNNLEEMKELYSKGLTFQQIGDYFGFSRQNIHATFKRLGVDLSVGGKRRRITSSIIAKATVEHHCYCLWGISIDKKLEIKKKFGYAPFRAYIDHRRNAKARGIEFLISFAQWWTIWQESGHWDERGVAGYVMSRPLDKGPYAIGNVKIISARENHLEYHRFTKLRECQPVV